MSASSGSHNATDILRTKQKRYKNSETIISYIKGEACTLNGDNWVTLLPLFGVSQTFEFFHKVDKCAKKP